MPVPSMKAPSTPKPTRFTLTPVTVGEPFDGVPVSAVPPIVFGQSTANKAAYVVLETAWPYSSNQPLGGFKPANGISAPVGTVDVGLKVTPANASEFGLKMLRRLGLLAPVPVICRTSVPPIDRRTSLVLARRHPVVVSLKNEYAGAPAVPSGICT